MFTLCNKILITVIGSSRSDHQDTVRLHVNMLWLLYLDIWSDLSRYLNKSAKEKWPTKVDLKSHKSLQISYNENEEEVSGITNVDCYGSGIVAAVVGKMSVLYREWMVQLSGAKASFSLYLRATPPSIVSQNHTGTCSESGERRGSNDSGQGFVWASRGRGAGLGVFVVLQQEEWDGNSKLFKELFICELKRRRRFCFSLIC